MIEDIRIRDYILSLEPDLDPVLSQIEETALAGQIPIIRKETGALLKTLVAAEMCIRDRGRGAAGPEAVIVRERTGNGSIFG